MASIDWIKLSVHLFENAKICYLKEKFGKEAVLLWVYMLTLAGKRFDGGRLMISETMPYTVSQLARGAEMKVSEVRRILKVMEQLKMTETMNDCIVILNWCEHQSAEKLDLIREQTRLRVAKFREKNKAKCNVTCNVTDSVTVTLPVTQCNAVEENRKEKNRLEEIRGEQSAAERAAGISPEREERLSFEGLEQMYRQCCPSLLEVCPLEQSRRAEVEALLGEHPPDYFRRLFQRAERSPFLRGDNTRGWRAGFEWLMRPVNMGKVLVGAYDRVDLTERSQYLTEYQHKALEEMFEK